MVESALHQTNAHVQKAGSVSIAGSLYASKDTMSLIRIDS